MKIVMTSAKREFQHAHVGDVFDQNGTYFLKISPTAAFNLHTNYIVVFDLQEMLEIVNCELVIH